MEEQVDYKVGLIRKKYLLILIFVLIIITLCGCSTKEYNYSIVAQDVYLEGERMRGTSPSAIDVELVLNDKSVKSGVDVTLHHFGTRYHGTVKGNGSMNWDNNPVLVADATYKSSKIENYNSGIKITYNYSIFYKGTYLDCKVIQTFSQK